MAFEPAVQNWMRQAFMKFQAHGAYVGERCCLCPDLILPQEKIRYYGGPFIAHDRCIESEFDRA